MGNEIPLRELAAGMHRRCECGREDAIDTAMSKAASVYQTGVRTEDPYAMHKAVESLPVCVLVDVLRMKTKWDFMDSGGGGV